MPAHTSIKLVLSLMMLTHIYLIYLHTNQYQPSTTGNPPLPLLNLSDSLTNVPLLLSPVPCDDQLVDILSVVHSAVGNIRARDAIRATWGASKHELGIVSRVVFILGVNNTKKKEVEEEAQQHGDIVQADFIDAYHNMSYKNLLGLTWVANWCPQAKLVVKTDDDYFIDIYGVHHLSKELQSNPTFEGGGLLACPMIVNSIVWRDPKNKESGRWAITQEELPSSRLKEWRKPGMSNDYYPPYCTGMTLVTI